MSGEDKRLDDFLDWGNGEHIWNKLPGRGEEKKDALIEASAGTGKTYTLERVVLRLVREYGTEFIKKILIVTFTEKAAGELQDRIRAALEATGRLTADFNEATICTIHSFCRELLTEYAFENRVPMANEMESTDEPYVEQAVHNVLAEDGEVKRELNARGKEIFDKLNDELKNREKEWRKQNGLGGGTKEAMSWSKIVNEWLPERVKERLAGLKTFADEDDETTDEDLRLVAGIIGKAAKEALRLKRAAGVLTFDDLVQNASAIIGAESGKERAGGKSALLESIRGKYRVALVDEFQDTDNMQWTIFRSLFSRRNFEGAKPEEQGFLLVVGDPKQAIYSFRGADVNAYLEARKDIVEKGGMKFELNRTYRSSKGLIDAFNKIFSGGGWFEEEGGGGISYSEVEYPEGNPKFEGYEDNTGRGAVTLLESMPGEPGEDEKTVWSDRSGYGKRERLMPTYSDTMAREMKRLAGLKEAYKIAGEGRRYEYRDMCVLVRGKRDAQTVAKALKKNGIPFGWYKERGIYAGTEAEAVRAVFDFLAEPARAGNLAALYLTPFFGVEPKDLARELGAERKERAGLLDKWQEYAKAENWVALAESLMNDTKLAQPEKGDYEYDRTWTTIRQILDELLRARGGGSTTAAKFAQLLRKWKNDPKRSGEDGAIRRKDSDANRVQIMTMHASKGLEFKLTFVAYGFNDYLHGTAAEKKREAAEEERRLLYVALTRAGHKLYLPWSEWAEHKRATKKEVAAEGGEGEKPKKGKGKAKTAKEEVVEDEIGLGPVGAALLDFKGFGFLAKAVTGLQKELGLKVVSRKEMEEAEEAGAGEEEKAEAERAQVTVYDPGNLKDRRLHWDSFSSLNHHGGGKKSVKAEMSAGPERDKRDEGEEGADGEEAEPAKKEKLERLLKRGANSGTAFHEIMEDLCNSREEDGLGFGVGGREPKELLEDEKFMGIVRRRMRRNGIRNEKGEGGESTESVLARMVRNALRTEIRIGGKAFRLMDAGPGDRKAEVEFATDEAETLGVKLEREGVFNGSIDLLVRPDGPEGKAYIVDWKTNHLEDYGEGGVAAAMEEAGYHLQHRLYTLAAARWLGEEKAGGVAYLFVRAGAEEGAEGCGVYAEEVRAEDLGGLREKIRIDCGAGF